MTSLFTKWSMTEKIAEAQILDQETNEGPVKRQQLSEEMSTDQDGLRRN